MAVAVGKRRIDEVDPQFEGPRKRMQAPGIFPTQPLFSPDSPSAIAYFTYAKIGPTQFAVLHLHLSYPGVVGDGLKRASLCKLFRGLSVFEIVVRVPFTAWTRPNMMNVMADQLDGQVHVGADLREFGSWMASEQRRIFLLCRRLLQDPDEADSATQDVFLKAYRALSKGDAHELDHPDKWVTRIAVNTCLDRLRSKAWKIWQRRPRPEDEQVILAMATAVTPDAEAQLFAKQIQQRLELALQKLSNRQRAVFTCGITIRWLWRRSPRF